MNPYPKRILTIPQQLQSYTDAGMTISSPNEAAAALTTIGYYRLRGYSFHLYDNASKQYRPGTDFSDILRLYHFDMELSRLLFGMATCIEVALRARLSEALLTYNDALILTDPAVFSDKRLFWQNLSSLSSLSSQITRSNDVFIRHNFQNHDGEIPLWAAVEVMSFGMLSKTIKSCLHPFCSKSIQKGVKYLFPGQEPHLLLVLMGAQKKRRINSASSPFSYIFISNPNPSTVRV